MAEERPLLCVVDDAQWLDQASALTLAFVARRLLAEPVGIVFAAREPGEELQHAARARGAAACATATRARCWARRCGSCWTSAVRDRIIAETRGNPLALLELPRGLTATQLAGGFGMLGGAGALGTDRGELRPATRGAARGRAASAAGRGGRADRRSAAAAGARPSDSGSGRRRARRGDGRAAGGRRARDVPSSAGALGGVPIGRRRRSAGRSHLALAEATDREVDPDRRAWHLAAAAAGPDEQVALELERSAGRAQARGGLAAAAAFLQRAVALTGDPARRAERALAAAQASLRAGAFDVARGLLATAEVGPLDELQRARLDLLRAEAAYSESRGSDAPALLLRAAQDARAARSAARARDLSRRVELGAVRRAAREHREPARGLARSPGGSAAGRASARRPTCCWTALRWRSPTAAPRRRRCSRRPRPALRAATSRSRRSCAGGGSRPRPP